MFDGDAAVHAGVFVDDAGAGVARDEDVGGDVGECAVGGQAEQLAECVCVCQCVGDQGHGEASVVDAVGVFVWICHVCQDVLGAVFGDDLGIEGCDGVVDGEERGIEEFCVAGCYPIVGEFLSDVSIDVVLVVCIGLAFSVHTQ